jgi:hypothetical protein
MRPLAHVSCALLPTEPDTVVIASGNVISPFPDVAVESKLPMLCSDTFPLTVTWFTFPPYVMTPVPAPVLVVLVPLKVMLPLVTLFGAALFMVIVPPPVLVTLPTVAASFVLITPSPLTERLPTVEATFACNVVATVVALLVKFPVAVAAVVNAEADALVVMFPITVFVFKLRVRALEAVTVTFGRSKLPLKFTGVAPSVNANVPLVTFPPTACVVAVPKKLS